MWLIRTVVEGQKKEKTTWAAGWSCENYTVPISYSWDRQSHQTYTMLAGHASQREPPCFKYYPRLSSANVRPPVRLECY